MALAVTDKTFQAEVLNSNVPVLVDFWAAWCGPCLMIAPAVEQLANEYAGKAKVVKLNVDENQYVASQYGIRSIPTLLVFHKGKVVDQIIGAVPKKKLAAHLDQAIEKAGSVV
ncbi:MAG: thioredoxin [Bacteroidetes Order II. Incertae sedis bacterium]|nr:thioredoxin [Bacteroidetes Order II. bacterium]